MYENDGYKGGVKQRSLKARAFILVAIFILHLVAIYYFTLANFASVDKNDKASIFYLSPEISFQKPLKIIPPELNIVSPPQVLMSPPIFEIENTHLVQPSALPADLEPYLNSMQGKYSNVFDPRMRKKLAESNQLVSKPKSEKYKTTYLSGGGMMVELGDGRCMVSMPKAEGSLARGTAWSTNTVPCGKSDSEKFMDNVQRDLDERKGKKQ